MSGFSAFLPSSLTMMFGDMDNVGIRSMDHKIASLPSCTPAHGVSQVSKPARVVRKQLVASIIAARKPHSATANSVAHGGDLVTRPFLND